MTIPNPRCRQAHRRNWWLSACGMLLLWAASAIALSAQTFTTLHSFDGTDGAAPSGTLMQATDGNLYGTAAVGGGKGDGTVYKITTGGTLTKLASFTGTNGGGPNGGLVQAANGNFYGTTVVGTTYGSVFEMTPGGELTSLHSFLYSESADLEAGLVEGTNGIFYGTGAEGGDPGYGSVWSITTAGAVTVLHSFVYTDGANTNGLMLGDNGNLYGTTKLTAGSCLGGNVFEVTPGGTFTSLYNFDNCVDGGEPIAPPVQAANGDLIGTTTQGGPDGDGTVYSLTLSGTPSLVYSFTDTYAPGSGYSALVLGTDGNFYGTSFGEPGAGDGTIFQVTPAGTFTTLHTFSGADGATPVGLFQATNGIFYGETSAGGANNDGTVYSLEMGLGPFVQTLPFIGKAGTPVRILGTDLTGATSVSFNGIAATFTVASPSLIKTTVPAGATTGKVRVTTPSGTLVSNVAFRVAH